MATVWERAFEDDQTGASFGDPTPLDDDLAVVAKAFQVPVDEAYDPLALDMGEAMEVQKAGGRFGELGTTGLKQTGGFVQEEFLRQLSGTRGLRVYREMRDNDPVIGGYAHAIDMLVRQVEWRVEPAEAASVEEILAKRQEARARAIEASQAAEVQRQEQAKMAAQGMAGEGGPGMPAAKGQPGTAPTKPTKDAVKKALDYFEISMDVDEWIARADNPRAFKKERPATDPGEGGTDGAVGNSAKKKSRMPATTDEFLSADPKQLAEIEGEENAIFVETCTKDMDTPWEDAISEILSFLWYGFHPAELVYKRRNGPGGSNPKTTSRFDDGKIGWRKWAPRAQDTVQRWDFDDDGSLKGFFQHDPSQPRGMVYIPFEKMLLFRTQAHRGNPEGRSILRNAYRPWYFKRRIEEIEAIGIERDLAGLPVAYVPWRMLSAAATVEERQALAEIKRIVRNIKRDEQEGLVFPMQYEPETHNKMFELTLLSTAGQRQFDTDKIVARYDQRIAMTVLADFLMLGHEAVGSKALGATKVDLFTAALEAWLGSIAQVVNTFAIPRLMKVNGMDPALSPRLTHGRLSQIDLTELGDFLVKISQAGAPLFPDEKLEGYLRDVTGLPTKEGSEEL